MNGSTNQKHHFKLVTLEKEKYALKRQTITSEWQ